MSPVFASSRGEARTTPVAWAMSLVALVVAVYLRWLLDPLMGDALPLVTLFGAVAAAVWVGGYRPAVVVGVVGYAACDYLFIAPRGQFRFVEVGHLVGLAAYVFTGFFIIIFGEQARAAQIRARERGELLRVTLASIGDAVITTDVECRVTYMNQAAEALTGWSQQDAAGLPVDAVFRVVSEDTRQPVENPAARALRDGVVVGLANHTVLIRKDATERSIDDSAAPIRDEEGRVSGCVLIFRDVTRQRQLEREKASQLHAAQMLASIVETSDDAIISKSLDGVIQSWNAAAERLFGYPAAEAVGRHVSLLIPRDRLAEEDRIIASLRAGQRVVPFETERVRSDGERIFVSLAVSPIMDETGRVVGASKVVRDITDRKRVEADRERLATLIESSTDFIGICDLEAVPLFVNRAGLQMVGLDDIAQARRTHVRDFFFPEDQDRVMNEFFPAVLQSGHGEIEIRFRHFKTGEARWMAYKILILTDASGRPTAVGTVSQDITERKRLTDDLRRLAADLSDADRRKDEFLATLAHELRNPLAPLRSMLEVLKKAGDDREVAERARDTIERQLGLMVRLVDDLLDLNRITHNRLELRRSQVDLASVILQAVEAAKPLAEAAGHELRVTLPAEPVPLDADPARLAQVFGNLLNNSCKYTRPDGHISLTAERVGPDVVVTVKDDGIGIPPDELPTVFDMFTQVDRSLERSQGGLGIGLTLAKRLVEMHAGSIEARSAGAGHGSEFVVRLPCTAEPKSAVTQPAREDADRLPAHRILVVDDNTDAAVSLAMLLGLAGHQTHLAHDGVAALEAIETHRPDVVLLDIGLPQLSGHEVCRRARQQTWGRDVVFIALTGWGQDEDRRRSLEAGFDGHLVKPVDHDALVKLLSTLVPRQHGHFPAHRA